MIEKKVGFPLILLCMSWLFCLHWRSTKNDFNDQNYEIITAKVHVFWKAKIFTVKSTLKVSSIFVAFLENMNFSNLLLIYLNKSFKHSWGEKGDLGKMKQHLINKQH